MLWFTSSFWLMAYNVLTKIYFNPMGKMNGNTPDVGCVLNHFWGTDRMSMQVVGARFWNRAQFWFWVFNQHMDTAISLSFRIQRTDIIMSYHISASLKGMDWNTSQFLTERHSLTGPCPVSEDNIWTMPSLPVSRECCSGWVDSWEGERYLWPLGELVYSDPQWEDDGICRKGCS